MPVALGATRDEYGKIVAAGDFRIFEISIQNLKLYLSKDKYFPITQIRYNFGKDGVINEVTGDVMGLEVNKKDEDALKVLIQQIKTHEKHSFSSDERLKVVVPQPYLKGKKAELTFGPLPIFDKKYKNWYPSMVISVK